MCLPRSSSSRASRPAQACATKPRAGNAGWTRTRSAASRLTRAGEKKDLSGSPMKRKSNATARSPAARRSAGSPWMRCASCSASSRTIATPPAATPSSRRRSSCGCCAWRREPAAAHWPAWPKSSRSARRARERRPLRYSGCPPPCRTSHVNGWRASQRSADRSSMNVDPSSWHHRCLPGWSPPIEELLMMTPSSPARGVPCIGMVLSLSLLLAASTALAQPVPRPAPPPDPLVRMNESIDALTRKVWPSVVQILVSSYGPRNEGPPGSAGVVIGQAAVHRLGVRDRPGGLHHDERARGERRAAGPDCAARGQRRRDAGDGVVRQGEARRRTDRRHHHRTGSGAVEGRGPETPGAAAGDLLRKSGRARWCLRSAAPTGSATA